MPSRLLIALTAEQRADLVFMRDHHKTPYLRERAAAIIKVADGDSCNHVAATGLLRPHKTDTVRGWCHRYLDVGIDGLSILPGRGRKPGFSPSVRQ